MLNQTKPAVGGLLNMVSLALFDTGEIDFLKFALLGIHHRACVGAVEL